MLLNDPQSLETCATVKDKKIIVDASKHRYTLAKELDIKVLRLN